MLLVPKFLKLKMLNDLKMDSSFETLFLEISVANIKLIVVVVYNPYKQLISDFSDEVVFKTDKISTMRCKMALIGNLNINYLNMNKQQSSLDTILTPYNVEPCNQSIPTMQKLTSLIDYVITDDTTDNYKTYVFKT